MHTAALARRNHVRRGTRHIRVRNLDRAHHAQRARRGRHWREGFRHSPPREVPPGDRNAQSVDAALQLWQHWLGLPCAAHRIARVGPVQSVERQRQISDRSRERTHMIEALAK